MWCAGLLAGWLLVVVFLVANIFQLNSSKFVFLFRIVNKSKRCENIHRLELCKFFKLCVAHLPVKRGIRMTFNIIHFFLFTIYKVIHSYIQITFSLYKNKITINSIINCAYLKQLVIRSLLLKTRLIHHNLHIQFTYTRFAQMYYNVSIFPVRRRINIIFYKRQY